MSTGKTQKTGATNPTVERCLQQLSDKTAMTKNYGKPRPGGLNKEYPTPIPEWQENDGHDSTYYRIVVHGGKFELLSQQTLPDKRYRDPTPTEAKLLLKRYGGNVVQGTTGCTKKRCKMGLYYRIHKDDKIGTKIRTRDYERIIQDYRTQRKTFSKFFRKILPTVAEFTDIVELVRESEDHERFLASLPAQIRACHPSPDEIKNALRLRQEIRNEYRLIEDAITDWVTIETSTKPIIDEITTYYMPDTVPLGHNERRYLTKAIYAVLEIGIPAREIIEYAADLCRPRTRKEDNEITREWLTPEAFVHALTLIIYLKLAKQLHKESLAQKGIGIADNFDSFVDTTIKNIRERRIHFTQLPDILKKRGAGANYLASANAIRLPSTNIVEMRGAKIWFEIMIHEATHSFNDWRAQRLTRPDDEHDAYSNGIKAAALFAQRGSYKRHHYLRRRLEEKRIHYWNMKRSGRIATARCLDLSDSIVDRYAKKGKTRRLRAIAQQGFEREMEGEAWPEAHTAIRNFNVLSPIASWIYGGVRARATYIGRLIARRPKTVVEGLLAGACSTLSNQLRRADIWRFTRNMKQKDLYHLLNTSYAIIHSTIYYIQPDALPTLNTVMEQHLMPAFKELVRTLPATTDGV